MKILRTSTGNSKRTSRRNHLHVAISYNNIGSVCRDTGDLEKAKEYYQLALKIGKEQLGPNHAHVAAFYNNLGTVI